MFTDSTNDGETYCIKYNYQLGNCTTEQISFTCKVDEPKGYEMTMEMNIFRNGKNKL